MSVVGRKPTTRCNDRRRPSPVLDCQEPAMDVASYCSSSPVQCTAESWTEQNDPVQLSWVQFPLCIGLQLLWLVGWVDLLYGWRVARWLDRSSSCYFALWLIWAKVTLNYTMLRSPNRGSVSILKSLLLLSAHFAKCHRPVVEVGTIVTITRWCWCTMQHPMSQKSLSGMQDHILCNTRNSRDQRISCITLDAFTIFCSTQWGTDYRTP